MSIQIKHKKLDLYKVKISNPLEEMNALYEIQGQIKKSLNTLQTNPNDIETLLINKLVYYSVKDIQTINPDLKISMGWYKYGPCFEHMRNNEMDKYTFNITCESNAPVEEIQKNCERETPLFLKSRKTVKSIEGRYFYQYLQHIYTERVDVTELKKVYPAKLELSHTAYAQAHSNKYADSKQIRRLIFNFNKSIIEEGYTHFVGMEFPILDKIEDYLITLQDLIIFNNELHEKNEPNSDLETFSRMAAIDFEETIWEIFAYKNYKSTMNYIDEELDKQKKTSFEECIQNDLKLLNYKIKENISMLSKINGF